MKLLYKLIIPAAIAMGLVSCSDDEATWNTASDVQVEMEYSSLERKESGNIFTVPVRVTGTPNGNIRINLKVVDANVSQDNQALEDINFYITTKTLVITPEDNVVNVEVSTVDNKDIDPDRSFILQIESAEGATVNTQRQDCLVTILDNDSAPYDRLSGNWTFSYLDMDNVEYRTAAVISGAEFGTPAYEKTLSVVADVISGLSDGTMTLSFDGAAMNVGLMSGVVVYPEVNFNFGPGDIYTSTSGGSIAEGTSILGTWDENFTEINFGNGQMYLMVTDHNSGSVMGYYDLMSAIKFVRSAE